MQRDADFDTQYAMAKRSMTLGQLVKARRLGTQWRASLYRDARQLLETTPSLTDEQREFFRDHFVHLSMQHDPAEAKDRIWDWFLLVGTALGDRGSEAERTWRIACLFLDRIDTMTSAQLWFLRDLINVPLSLYPHGLYLPRATAEAVLGPRFPHATPLWLASFYDNYGAQGLLCRSMNMFEIETLAWYRKGQHFVTELETKPWLYALLAEPDADDLFEWTRDNLPRWHWRVAMMWITAWLTAESAALVTPALLRGLRTYTRREWLADSFAQNTAGRAIWRIWCAPTSALRVPLRDLFEWLRVVLPDADTFRRDYLPLVVAGGNRSLLVAALAVYVTRGAPSVASVLAWLSDMLAASDVPLPDLAPQIRVLIDGDADTVAASSYA